MGLAKAGGTGHFSCAAARRWQHREGNQAKQGGLLFGKQNDSLRHRKEFTCDQNRI